MSSNGFEPPLRIEPRASIRARTCLVLLYGLAGVGIAWFAGLLPALVLLVFAVIACVHEWHRLARPRLIEWSGDGAFRVEGTGAWRLDRSTVLTPWLVVLVLRDEARTQRIPLFPDSLPVEQWRRLRARLRVYPADA